MKVAFALYGPTSSQGFERAAIRRQASLAPSSVMPTKLASNPVGRRFTLRSASPKASLSISAVWTRARWALYSEVCSPSLIPQWRPPEVEARAITTGSSRGAAGEGPTEARISVSGCGLELCTKPTAAGARSTAAGATAAGDVATAEASSKVSGWGAVVWMLAGFAVGVVCSFVGTQVMGEFGPLVTLRIAIGSALAFLIGQLLDIALFDRLRRSAWWRAMRSRLSASQA